MKFLLNITHHNTSILATVSGTLDQSPEELLKNWLMNEKGMTEIMSNLLIQKQLLAVTSVAPIL